MNAADQAGTERNRAVMTRYAQAWQAGDLAALRDCYHDQFTLHYSGKHSLAGDHVGKAAALAVLAEVSRRSGRKLLEIVDILAGPYRAAIIVQEQFQRDGEAATLMRTLVYTIESDRLRECWVLDAQQDVVDRFLR